jgi:ubiquinone biosynthesis protein
MHTAMTDVAAPARSPRARALLARGAGVGAVTVGTLVPAAVGAVVQRLRHGPGAGRRHLRRSAAPLLIRLGPTFVKAGQVLGTRRDVLSPQLCDELSVLTDDLPAMSPADTRTALREAYGDTLDEVFDQVCLTPVASGSVACVHRARLRGSGREVAVKLRRPGVRETMALDLEIMRRGAALVARLPVFDRVPVRQIVDHLADAMAGQLDFEREATALARLRANLATVPRVWVPQVHLEACRPSCIVMEFIPGLSTDTAAQCPPMLRRRFGNSGLTAVYQMLFVDGFVHCDLHPGNLYFTRAGQVVVLDAGFSVQLEDRLRRLFAEFFMDMALGRGERAARVVVQSAAGIAPDADVEGFVERMAELVERSHGQSAKEFSLVGFATEMFDLQRRSGVHAAPEIVFPLLALLVIEGTIRALDPDVDFQEAAKPVIVKGLYGRRG